MMTFPNKLFIMKFYLELFFVLFSFTKKLKFVQKSLRTSRLRSQIQPVIIMVCLFFFDLWCFSS